MSTLERAIRIAVEAHQSKLDKAGAPYILHPLRVMLQMDTTAERIVAVLHDVVEDSGWSLGDLEREGFPSRIVQAVGFLTRRDGETYDDFIRRLAQNPLARKIKLADLEDNMDIRRLPQITEKDLERLAKYHQAWLMLAGREGEA